MMIDFSSVGFGWWTWSRKRKRKRKKPPTKTLDFQVTTGSWSSSSSSLYFYYCYLQVTQFFFSLSSSLLALNFCFSQYSTFVWYSYTFGFYEFSFLSFFFWFYFSSFLVFFMLDIKLINIKNSTHCLSQDPRKLFQFPTIPLPPTHFFFKIKPLSVFYFLSFFSPFISSNLCFFQSLVSTLWIYELLISIFLIQRLKVNERLY